jgi:hypothetical protein
LEAHATSRSVIEPTRPSGRVFCMYDQRQHHSGGGIFGGIFKNQIF